MSAWSGNGWGWLREQHWEQPLGLTGAHWGGAAGMIDFRWKKGALVGMWVIYGLAELVRATAPDGISSRTDIWELWCRKAGKEIPSPGNPVSRKSHLFIPESSPHAGLSSLSCSPGAVGNKDQALSGTCIPLFSLLPAGFSWSCFPAANLGVWVGNSTSEPCVA